MLDPRQFWAETAGPAPGEPATPLDQAKALYTHLGQPAAGGGPGPTREQLDAFRQRLLGGALPDGSPVAQDQMAAWEKRYGVKLPALFRDVFQQRNGGVVRGTDVEIYPLTYIQPVDADDLFEDEFPDPGLVFAFASDGGPGSYLLDYNARGADGEPAVYLADFGMCELDKVAGSVETFFRKLLRSAADPAGGPEVDWSETERLTVLARERLDLTGHHPGGPAALDQVLCRDTGALVLFVRRCGGDEETLTRTVLPEPLSTNTALGAGRIETARPGRTDLWTLQLQPRDSEGIVQTESTRTSAGRWKNRTSHGVPIYQSIWSADRDRLTELRAEVLGTGRAGQAAEADDAQQELQARLQALPPAAQRAALVEMSRQALADSERLFQEQNPDAGEPPPEVAAMMALLEGKLREARRRFQEGAAQHPLDPETRALIERMRKAPRPGAGD